MPYGATSVFWGELPPEPCHEDEAEDETEEGSG